MVLKRTVQRFKTILRMARLCSAVCGADVFDPDYRINPLTIFVLLAINSYLICTGYTIYVDIYIERDWTKVLQALCLLGSAVQGYCKLLNGIWKKHTHRFLINELLEIYEKYDKYDADYRCYLSKSLDTVTYIIKIILVVYAGSVIGIISVVPIYRLLFHENIFVMQFLLPGIDPETEFGYIVMNCMHCTCIFFGAFGNFAADTFFFTYVSQIPLLANIMKCKFRDLNEELEELDMQDNRYKTVFKDILQWHQKYMKFISTVKDIYFWVVLVEMSTIALSIASTLFCLLLGKWVGGHGYLIYCFVILYLYCGLGTMVEISNDDVINSCYTDVIWYKLPVPEKKMLRMMLMMAQNTTGLTVGAVMPLTMNTGLQLTKAIYTWTMMLINFIN